MIAKGPIIFLSLNQASTGEFDAYYEPVDWYWGGWTRGPLDFGISDVFFNYTHFQYIWGDKYNIAPRYHYSAVTDIAENGENIENQNFMMWDTQLEK